MKKFLACDVDGTLVHGEGILLDKAVCEAIHSFRGQGHAFALCTGRTLNWVHPLFEQSPLEADGLILANGASLYTINQFSPLSVNPLASHSVPASIGVEIIRYLYNEEDVMIYWGDGERTYELSDRRLQIAGSFEMGSDDTVYLTYEDYIKAPMDIIGFGAAPRDKNETEARRIAGVLRQRWGHVITVVNNVFFIDIMIKSVSKGEGIRRFLELTGGLYLCYGLGDSFNDESMFRHVGKERAFLMANGDDELSPLVRQRVHSVIECIDIILSDKDPS